jgi:beta-phosphoglucomutase-like phosphatase (HAD superfamily)
MGIGDQPILEALAKLDAADRAQAQAILHRHEEHAAENSTLNVGCSQLLGWLNRERIPVALITRNSRRSVECVLERHGLCLGVVVAAPPTPGWSATAGTTSKPAWPRG